MTTKPTRRLTKKQLGFAQEFVKTGIGRDAVMKSYDVTDPTMATVIASQNLSKPIIQEAIKSIAEQIPDKLLVKKHLALLNKVDANGDIDPNAVRAGLDMAYKLKGSYEATEVKGTFTLELVKYADDTDPPQI